MSENNVEQPAEDAPVEGVSRIFPTEIKYETHEGAIESVWVKEADVAFISDVDDDGVPVSDKIVIQLTVENKARDLVLHQY